MERMMFANLVAAFGVEFKLVLPENEKKGKYVHGEWQRADQEPTIASGALIPYDDRTIYQSGGTLTTSDRQLAFVGDIPLGSIVIDGDREFKVEGEEPYRDHYADTNLYRLKAVKNNG